ncbi:MAG: class I SAM-dependent methyltransferase [Nitrospirae bacterium]|nr:class I SAM-dependent methyltransferase [Nitrospirota bacterium]MCL5238034.1 class I SAM-dependent methyltransferase [Nitrospirota bacterium]
MRICPSYLSFILYNPIRKALTNREKVLEESGINRSSVVLEVGAGNGFITEALAQKAKKVYALELQEGMVRKLKKRMRKFGDKVDIILGDIATYSIRSAFADVVLMYYSFHEVGNQADAAKNISTAIKPGGKLSIYEPTIEVKKSDMQKTVRLFESAGFEKEAIHHGAFTRFARLRKKRL